MGAEKTWGVLHFLLWYYQQSDVLDSWRQKALKVLCQECLNFHIGDFRLSQYLQTVRVILLFPQICTG